MTMARSAFQSYEGVSSTSNTAKRPSTHRRIQSCALSLLICLIALNVQSVLSINFIRTDSARRRPKAQVNHAVSNEEADHGFTAKRKDPFRFNLLLPSWFLLSRPRRSLQLLAVATGACGVSEMQPFLPSATAASVQCATTTTTTSESSSKSVHMQLNELADDNGETGAPEDMTNQVPQPQPPSNTTRHSVKIHTYKDPRTGSTWKALNTAKSKFHAFMEHENKVRVLKTDIVTEEMVLAEDNGGDTRTQAARDEWRDLWKKRQLLTDRTELLAVYPSDKDAADETSCLNTADASNTKVKTRRGGFADLLFLYTERLVAILRDEHDETQCRTGAVTTLSGSDNVSDDSMIVDWLKKSYGNTETDRLRASSLSQLPEKEQLGQLKTFLEWFRTQFPYYYDRCGSCGASIKEDHAHCPPPPTPPPSAASSDDKVETTDQEEAHHEHQTFVGYIYPADDELAGKASRTEVYHCHKCQSFTRFPRFNSVSHVIDSKRGRCGEYSMLLYRILRALDHEARWVVDWADHVWAEVSLGGSNDGGDTSPRWVHLDPCEAAVDENLIYQGWGKKQTYILGFYAPQRKEAVGTNGNANLQAISPIAPVIEDITASYTSDSWEDICKRREESRDAIQLSMEKAVGDLADKLSRVGENGHE